MYDIDDETDDPDGADIKRYDNLLDRLAHGLNLMNPREGLSPFVLAMLGELQVLAETSFVPDIQIRIYSLLYVFGDVNEGATDDWGDEQNATWERLRLYLSRLRAHLPLKRRVVQTPHERREEERERREDRHESIVQYLDAFATGVSMPFQAKHDEPTERVSLRLPRSLKKRLQQEADRLGVSLTDLICDKLVEKDGEPNGTQKSVFD